MNQEVTEEYESLPKGSRCEGNNMHHLIRSNGLCIEDITTLRLPNLPARKGNNRKET